jgi:hypothetical protein
MRAQLLLALAPLSLERSSSNSSRARSREEVDQTFGIAMSRMCRSHPAQSSGLTHLAAPPSGSRILRACTTDRIESGPSSNAVFGDTDGESWGQSDDSAPTSGSECLKVLCNGLELLGVAAPWCTPGQLVHLRDDHDGVLPVQLRRSPSSHRLGRPSSSVAVLARE